MSTKIILTALLAVFSMPNLSNSASTGGSTGKVPANNCSLSDTAAQILSSWKDESSVSFLILNGAQFPMLPQGHSADYWGFFSKDGWNTAKGAKNLGVEGNKKDGLVRWSTLGHYIAQGVKATDPQVAGDDEFIWESCATNAHD